MTPPKVSIIIPVYNSETSLQACLDSALQQTLNDIEVICVDDCSTDTSSDILLHYSNNETRVKILKHSINKGEGAARNTGLDNAKGEYIFHLDADDTIPLGAMETLYAEAHEHGSDMTKGRYDLIHEDGEIQPQLWSVPEQKIINTNIYESEFLQQIPTSHCTYLYKREFLDLQNIRYRTDLVVGLDLIALATALMHAKTITLIPDLVYYYHQSDTSATRGKITAKTVEDAIRSKQIVADMLETRGMHEAANTRLKKWEFIIDTFFREIPSSLTIEESRQTFSDFRNLITTNKLVPWMASTPHHYRYTLALIIDNKDEEALSFLQTKEAFEGFSDQDKLKESLNFVLQQVPDDLGSSIELGRIARSEGRLQEALDIFKNIFEHHPENYEAQLQATGTLIQLGENKKARDKLDTILDNLTKGLDFGQQINKAATLKEFLVRGENTSKLCAVRDKLKKHREELKVVQGELNAVRGELNAVYTSTSWRITKPLRKIKASIKRKA